MKRRPTPIPVAPPRIPTPMPVGTNNNNNNNNHSRNQPPMRDGNGKCYSRSIPMDNPQLVTKASYKRLDNDVKTAWINPRLLSKVNLENVKKRSNSNMNNSCNGYENYGKNLSQLYPLVPSIDITTAVIAATSTTTTTTAAAGGPSLHSCCTLRTNSIEWENCVETVNGRGKVRTFAASSSSTAQQLSDGAIRRLQKNKQQQMDPYQDHNSNNNNNNNNNNSDKSGYNRYLTKTSKLKNQRTVQRPVFVERVKGVGYHHHQQHHQQSAYCVERGATEMGLVCDNSEVYGVYSETKYTFAVNRIGRNSAQSSTAAAFFARAAQKLNLSSSPHRRKRHNSAGDGESIGFCGILQRSPPPVPPALLRRIGVKEVTGVGKVKVMLRVSNPSLRQQGVECSNSFFSLDKRKKQVNLIDPSTCSGSFSAPEDRRVGVAAPKMFAFDAIFSHDDSQTEVCSSALTDVIHAVINGNDGCLFCFGHAGLGKSYTMLGTPENANTLGIIPCAISWLFKGINEQKQKTGARFSVRVSAVEVCGPTNQMKDLLSTFANDSEQSPGVYLREDPLFGNQPPHCELRVPTAERAAHYLDAALESRTLPTTREDVRDSHLLFTLHVYQYSVAGGKGGVAGGRSRLHLIDLGNSERGKASGGIPLSGVGNILLAIFNGQKHLPYKEHKLTHLLKDCLGSLTCHAAMIAHVSPNVQNYIDTLTTVQLASRIHRMRRKRIKFVSAGTGSGGSSGDEPTRTTTGTSSEPDPSSSDLSADTVIYVGPAIDDATDGEHPPVYIPSLNSGDNRCSMSKILRGSSVDQRLKAASTTITINNRPIINKNPCQNTTKSPKSSPNRQIKKPINGAAATSDEQWIDGPRISKSKVAEARHLIKEPCHIKKRETWIDGPMQNESQSYGYMDSHKKNMIRKWVEHQTSQIQKNKFTYPRKKEIELTQFKTCEQIIQKPLDTTKKQEIVEESTIRTGLKLPCVKNNVIEECKTPPDTDDVQDEDEDETVEIPPALPLIQPLSSREVSLESLDILLKERALSNAEYNNTQSSYDDIVAAAADDNQGSIDDDDDDDEILEIIEVEEPLEPVPTQDCCLQVTEEDIALCMGYVENPLPEVDQENPLDHPLRILSQENLTVVSTFTDSLSIYTDLERILPRHKYDFRYNDDYEDPDNQASINNGNFDDINRRKFEQLAKLHQLYTNRLAKAQVTNLESFNNHKSNQQIKRSESLCDDDDITGNCGGNYFNYYDHNHYNYPDNGSIYSEPAYIQEKFCENCKINMSKPANTLFDLYLSTSTQDLTKKPNQSGRFQRYCHNYGIDHSLAYLRQPDGASNPNLREENNRVLASTSSSSRYNNTVINDVNRASLLKETNLQSSASTTTQPPSVPPPNSLPSNERLNRGVLNIESGVAAIKLSQKSEGYDSGHDSTPRTSKHSPAAISRRAESGYDSVVRDSESSSIDSESSRRLTQNLQHANRRGGKCNKHKHEKSFCSWFLNPFTCKYIDDPPEAHF